MIPTEAHRSWLAAEGRRLLDFAVAARMPGGGFAWLDEAGRPDPDRPLELWVTCRMTHVFALGAMVEGAENAEEFSELADHGVRSLTGIFKDPDHDGWFASVRDGAPCDTDKQAYAHAFVVLAATSASAAGRPGAAALATEALRVLDERFWDPEHDMSVDVFSRDFSSLEDYRGINANMHTVEALLAAYSVRDDAVLLERAHRITERVVGRLGPDNSWRLPEHFDAEWNPLLDYSLDKKADPFRPYGATIGHSFEWARLTLELRAALLARGDEAPVWMLENARQLFEAATREGWFVDEQPGFVYTVDWDGNPVVRERMHWVAAEAVNTAVALGHVFDDEVYSGLYAAWWDYIDEYLIDHSRGSWHHELDQYNRPSATVWAGKPDVYHAYQATLFPRLPAAPAIAEAARRGLVV